EVNALMKHHEAYKALPRKVSQQVLRLLDKNWQAFFAACEAYREHPEQFQGCPQLPKYKHKTDGRSILIYTNQAISQTGLKQGVIVSSQLGIQVPAKDRACMSGIWVSASIGACYAQQRVN